VSFDELGMGWQSFNSVAIADLMVKTTLVLEDLKKAKDLLKQLSG